MNTIGRRFFASTLKNTVFSRASYSLGIHVRTLKLTRASRLPSSHITRAFHTSPTRHASNIPSRYVRFGKNGPGVNVSGNTILYITGGAVILGGGFYVTHLETVPISGRRRFIALTPEQEIKMAQESYKQILSEYKGQFLAPNHPYSRWVQRVADKLIPVSGLKDLNWEVHVIASPEKNAFVIPGGKIFVFSGILDIAKDDAGLATILGHEIAHNVARHTGERMSFMGLVMITYHAISLLIGDPGFIGPLVLNYGLLLPNSRAAETEADFIGLNLMSKACYDPRAATGVWQRMAAAERGAAPPQFASTHPASANRVKKFEEWMPEAVTTMNASDCVSELGGLADAFRDRYQQQEAEIW